tara:strand:- start:755 stop:1210 length:456 start_codon:yes stop_codon:yes gene_type:complete
VKDFKEIKNRKAKFEYHFLQSYEAGITLVGTEVKSIKSGLANLTDAYCIYKNGELFIKSLYIAEYPFGNVHNHETRRDRKLLLKKTELKKIERRVKEKGNSVIPYRIYLSERGMIKVEIHVAQGKKSYDKRESIRSKDQKRDLDRIKKISL